MTGVRARLRHLLAARRRERRPVGPTEGERPDSARPGGAGVATGAGDASGVKPPSDAGPASSISHPGCAASGVEPPGDAGATPSVSPANDSIQPPTDPDTAPTVEPPSDAETASARHSLFTRRVAPRGDEADDAELDTLRGELVRELARMAERPGQDPPAQ